jgi:hypothetical protein
MTGQETKSFLANTHYSAIEATRAKARSAPMRSAALDVIYFNCLHNALVQKVTALVILL